MFNAKVVFIEDYYNEGGENCFYRVPNEKHAPMEKPEWVLKVDSEVISYINTYSMLFKEEDKDRVYYWMLDPESDKEDRKEGDDYFFNLAWFKYGDTSEQKPNVFKRFNTKQIYSSSEVFNNRSFSKLVMFDAVDYRTPMMFDVEKGTTEILKIGSDLSMTKNPWAREAFIINYQDHLSQAWLWDSAGGKKTRSCFDGWYHRLTDSIYSETQKRYIEIKDDSLVGLKMGHSLN